jgi:hypothetical protein
VIVRNILARCKWLLCFSLLIKFGETQKMETRKYHGIKKSLAGLLLVGTVGVAYCDPSCSVAPYSAPSVSSAEENGRDAELTRSYSVSDSLETKA